MRLINAIIINFLIISPNFKSKIQQAIPKPRTANFGRKRKEPTRRNRKTTKPIIHIPVTKIASRLKSVKVEVIESWKEFIKTGR